MTQPERAPRKVRFPIRRKLTFSGLLFVTVVLALLFLATTAMETLSSVRGYVAGEGMWSKSQKDAVHWLLRYSESGDDGDWDRYRAALRVPLADHRARVEIEKDESDLSVSDREFAEARNHPEDVHGMSLLLEWGSDVSYLSRAVTEWKRGDALIAELETAATGLRARVRQGEMTTTERLALTDPIYRINGELTIAEDAFSATLGEAARWLKRTLVFATVSVTFATLAFALYVSWVLSDGVFRGIRALEAGTSRVAAGVLDEPIVPAADDELGALALAFNGMVQNLASAKSERDAAESALALRAAELENLNRELALHEKIKSEFFANVSHELRTPLALILGPAESLLSGTQGRLGDDTRPLVETIHNNAVRLLRIVQGLLDFQKLEAKKVDVRREPTDVVELTRGMVMDFVGMATKRKITLRSEGIAVPRPIVRVDRYLYERILFNLLSNALKFTPEGGEVRVGVTQEGPELRLSVADTGIGIAEADHAALFHRFQQVEGASTRRFEGTGLGLALVKEFAELLGGTVSLRSAPGQGSTFTVTLDAPVAEGEVPAPVRSAEGNLVEYGGIAEGKDRAPDTTLAPFAETKSKGARVLVVEDNRELASYLRSLLEVLAEVRVANDGDDALTLVESWHPTIVVSDVMMPKRDGLSLCRAMKAKPETRDVPFVLLTALTYREALLRGWEAGADDYLFKPFHPVEIVTRMRVLLEARLTLIEHERAAAEVTAELRRTASQLADAQAVAHVGSWEWDIGQDRITWSDELFRIYGVDPKTFRGTYEEYQARMFPDDVAHVRETVQRARETDTPFSMEHRITLPTGEVRWVHGRGEAVKDEGGRVVRMRGTSHDVTDRKRAEEDRMRLAEEKALRAAAESAVAVRDEFLSVASHELRTPLTPLQLQLELLSRSLREDPADTLSPRVDKALRQVHRLVVLSDRLLDVSRMAAGSLDLHVQDADLATLVRDVATQFVDDAAQAGSTLDVSTEGDLAARFDPVRIEQVVTNLVSNAIKYGRGGPITIRAERDVEGVRVIVADRGIGIDAESCSRVFGRFERAVSERAYGGLGLGLYIARQIVLAHGGTIELASESGVGSTFTVRLPLDPSRDRD
ncbi:MAG: ATP-binding protein [Polyangiaceae bacterium]